MNAREILSGNSTFQTTNHALATFANRLKFKLGFVAFIDFGKANNSGGLPEQVMSVEQQEALGLYGLDSQPKQYNLDSLLAGYAAITVLVVRQLQKTDPETFRKPEWLRKQIPDPKYVIYSQMNWFINNPDPMLEAEAAMLQVNPEERKAALTTERKAQAEMIVGPLCQHYYALLKSYANAEDDELIDVVLEGVVDAGYDPDKELVESARYRIDMEREKFNAGKRTFPIDAGIYALAGVKVTPVRTKTREVKSPRLRANNAGTATISQSWRNKLAAWLAS